jgi:hypothetical protein
MRSPIRGPLVEGDAAAFQNKVHLALASAKE